MKFTNTTTVRAVSPETWHLALGLEQKKGRTMLDDGLKLNPDRSPAGFGVFPASESEAADLARLAVIASENLCVLAWEDHAEGNETALEIGEKRAARKTGAFSYRNAEIAMQNRKVIGAIISYAMTPEPAEGSQDDIPPFFRPLLELERAAGRCWYINFLATYEPYRKQGVATALIAAVETQAKAAGFDRICLIAGNANPACALYRSLGFTAVAKAPVVSGEQSLPHDTWLLMEKPLR